MSKVTFRHDIVPIEHAACFMSEQRHGDPFAHTGADEVAGGSAAAIVQVPPLQVGLRARSVPTRLPRANGNAVAMKDERNI